MGGMNVEPVREANTRPIIVNQHFGISDLSEPQSMQGGPSSFQTHPNSSSFFNIGMPTNWQTPMSSQPGPSNWQSQMPAQSSTPYWQPAFSSHPDAYNWKSLIPSHMGNPNLQPPIERHHDAAGLFNQNLLNRGKREQRPSFYKRTPYTEQPPTTILPKQHVNKNNNNVMKANLSPLNLRNAFDDENRGDDIIFLGGEFTGNYLVYENVDPYKHMNAWMELLIRYRSNNDPWTVAYTNTISVQPENQRFLIETDQHTIGTLDGSTRPYPAWSVVNWIFLSIYVGGNHWVTGVIDLPNAHVYVFDSLPNEGRRNLLWNQIQSWTHVVNKILQWRGCFNEIRGPYNFQFSYNHGLGIHVPQQTNYSNCGVITSWLISCLCSERSAIVNGDPQEFWETIRNNMC
nr:hypothetical protein [Tanacetum cinerariifolium]